MSIKVFQYPGDIPDIIEELGYQEFLDEYYQYLTAIYTIDGMKPLPSRPNDIRCSACGKLPCGPVVILEEVRVYCSKCAAEYILPFCTTMGRSSSRE